MADKRFGAVIELKDKMTAGMKNISKESKNLQKNIKGIQSSLNKKMDIKVVATKAISTINKTKSAIKNSGLGKKVTTAIAIKDSVTKKVNEIKNKIRKITDKPMSVIIKAKDKISSILGGIGSKIKNIIGMAGKIVIGGAVAGVGIAKTFLQPGMELEKQQISMQHFLGGDKGKADSYIKELRQNANATPFETGEVVQAGTRALGIAGGDTKQAMELVKTAEDMAALTPGKTISDAMEALADAWQKIISHIGRLFFKYDLLRFIPFHDII